MTTVTDHLIGNYVVVDDNSGFHATADYILEGVSGAAHEKGFNALADAQIPAKYTLFPGRRDLMCVRRQATPASENSPDQIRVTLQFEPPGIPGVSLQVGADAKPPIEITSVVQEAPTNKDSDGKLILLQHTFMRDVIDPDSGQVTGQEIDPEVSPNPFKRVATVNKFIVLPSIEMIRHEDTNGLGTALDMVGAINLKPWFGFGPAFWLFSALHASTVNGGTSWTTKYGFTLSKDRDKDGRPVGGWDPFVVMIDPRTNDFVTDPVEGESQKRPTVQERRDFRVLGLT